MAAGKKTNLSRQRADLVHAASVNTALLIKQPAADNELLQLIQAFAECRFAVWIYILEMLGNLRLNDLESFFTDRLVIGVKRVLDIFRSKLFKRFKHVVVDVK